MGKKKQAQTEPEEMTPQELLKLEIAKEIGVFDKVMEGGWRSLSAKESGRIGGLLAGRQKGKKDKEEAE